MVCNNKYMYTKENWNPNVYDLNINYHDIKSNRRSVFTDELTEVSNKALPASQKSYVQYETKRLNHGQNTMKVNDNLEIKTLKLYETHGISDFRHDTVEYEYLDVFNIKRTKTQEIYTNYINLSMVEVIEIVTNSDVNYDTAVTMFKINQGSKEYTPRTPNFKNDYQIHTSTGESIFLYVIGQTGTGTLDIRTSNTEYFKEVKYHKVI